MGTLVSSCLASGWGCEPGTDSALLRHGGLRLGRVGIVLEDRRPGRTAEERSKRDGWGVTIRFGEEEDIAFPCRACPE